MNSSDLRNFKLKMKKKQKLLFNRILRIMLISRNADRSPSTMPTPSLFRSAKNKIGKYSESQIKVRNATSNDQGGPALHALIEIASLSFNPIILDEMLQILIKRLNDDGKNWRHIYKSLKVFEFLCLHGSKYSYEFSRRNIHYFESLKSFQHFKDSRECGGIIREVATRVVLLLTNESELQIARDEAKNVSEAVSRKNMHGKIGNFNAFSENTINTIRSQSSESSHSQNAIGLKNSGTVISEDLKKAIPASFEEEDCQLQVALALSKEEFVSNNSIEVGHVDNSSNASYDNKKNQSYAASVDDLLMIDFSSSYAKKTHQISEGNLYNILDQDSFGIYPKIPENILSNPFNQSFDSKNQEFPENIPFSPIHSQHVQSSNFDPFFPSNFSEPPLQFPVQTANQIHPISLQQHELSKLAQPTRHPEITPFNTNMPNQKKDPFDFLNNFMENQADFRSKDSSEKTQYHQSIQERQTNNPFL